MEGGSNVSAMEAMIRATIQAEKVWGSENSKGGWKSMLDDVVFQSTRHVDDKDRAWSHKVLHEEAKRYNNARILVKTTPPPAALKFDSVHLSDQIDSLQDLALVGRWHFIEMDDFAMRKWLEAQWKSLIGYFPLYQSS